MGACQAAVIFSEVCCQIDGSSCTHGKDRKKSTIIFRFRAGIVRMVSMRVH